MESILSREVPLWELCRYAECQDDGATVYARAPRTPPVNDGIAEGGGWNSLQAESIVTGLADVAAPLGFAGLRDRHHLPAHACGEPVDRGRSTFPTNTLTSGEMHIPQAVRSLAVSALSLGSVPGLPGSSTSSPAPVAATAPGATDAFGNMANPASYPSPTYAVRVFTRARRTRTG